MEGNEDLLPQYLRFIKGVIDTADLSLNVSREILQGNKVVDTIRKASVKRILSELDKMSKNRPEDYALFWKEFGMVMKEGVVEDFTNKDKIANLLRFATTKSEGKNQTVSLKDYVERMKGKQKTIYYVTAESYDAAKGSPHLEIFNRQKREINRKLSEGLITDRTAKIQMNKAIADEKMRLIIENQRKEKKVKPKTEPKKPASASTKEFEYVEKLKEIKSLREEGAITQAEFKKLKEKIIDSI